MSKLHTYLEKIYNEIESKLECRKCGTEPEEGDQFCQECGTRLVRHDAVHREPSENLTPDEKEKEKQRQREILLKERQYSQEREKRIAGKNK